MQLMRVHRSEPGPPGARPSGSSSAGTIAAGPCMRSSPGPKRSGWRSFGFSRSMIPSAQSAHPNATRAPAGGGSSLFPALLVKRSTSMRAAFRPIVFTARWAVHSKGASTDERIRPLHRLGPESPHRRGAEAQTAQTLEVGFASFARRSLRRRRRHHTRLRHQLEPRA
jgi:hypothetical protein